MSLVGVGEVFLRDNRVYHVEDLAHFGGWYKTYVASPVCIAPGRETITASAMVHHSKNPDKKIVGRSMCV